jgi:hypothetical protein
MAKANDVQLSPAEAGPQDDATVAEDEVEPGNTTQEPAILTDIC